MYVFKGAPAVRYFHHKNIRDNENSECRNHVQKFHKLNKTNILFCYHVLFCHIFTHKKNCVNVTKFAYIYVGSTYLINKIIYQIMTKNTTAGSKRQVTTDATSGELS